MLETVREFALERLTESGEEATVRTAHANWCLALAEEADAALRSRRDHARWLTRLQAEHTNFREALAWLRNAGDTVGYLQLAGALLGFWYFQGQMSEGRRWIKQALEHPANAPPAVRARALQSAGMLAHYQGDDRDAVPLLEASLPVWQGVGDPWGTALSLLLLGIVAEDAGEFDRAAPRLEEALSLFSAASYPIWEAHTRYHLAVVASGLGELDRAEALGEQARRQFEEEGDEWAVALSRYFLGRVAVECGNLARAATLFAAALPILRDAGQQESLVRCLSGVAMLAVATDRPHEAARLFAAVTAMAQVMGLAFDLPEQRAFAHAIAWARERLGEPAFDAAWAAGRTLTREDAVSEALELVSAAISTPLPALTRRETEILRLLAEDLPDAGIAEALFLSVRTVEWHVSNIITKLGVRSRAAAAAAGREAGVIGVASR
jgi:DNA-binding CsgD family transcriptional regulator